VNIVLEDGHKNVGDCIRIFDDLKRRFKHAGGDILGSITIEKTETCAPLMVADMLAHTMMMVNAEQRQRHDAERRLAAVHRLKRRPPLPRVRPDALRDLKAGFEKLRQLEADAWRERKKQRAAEAGA
jgi:hypothetical protein